MFEPSGSQHFPQYSSRELTAFTNCMIGIVEHRQREYLPASINPRRVSPNSGFNEFGFSGLPNGGLTNEGNGLMQKSLPHIETVLNRNQGHGGQIPMFPAKVGEKQIPSVCEPPSQQKKLLIFDRSGNETRVMFGSLCPRSENQTTPLTTSPLWNQQTWTRTPGLCEESGENEIIDEVSEMREDSDEINALLYSEDDTDDHDHSLNDDDDGNDDEVSSGHSPFSTERDHEKQEDEKEIKNEVASKRQKALQGGCKRLHRYPSFEDANDGDFIGAFKEIECPIVGNKRLRKDKIHDTLKVLESIIPGLKSKDPLVILDESIRYLKCLKYNAEAISMEDQDSYSCYQCLH